jgi:hypothetical protein
MNPDLEPIRVQLLELSRAEPFEPFRIRLVNGDAHNVSDPQSLVVEAERVWLFPPDQHWVVFPIVRINSMESLVSDFRGEAAAYEAG